MSDVKENGIVVDKKSAGVKGMQIVAIYRASVKATFGPGSLTALVKGKNGKFRLYGCTSLYRAGLLTEAKSYTDKSLAAKFGVPLVIGQAECLKHATDNKVVFEGDEKILSTADKKSGGFGRKLDFDF